MKTRILKVVGAYDIIEHTGDLTIEGDVGPNARIKVTDGSLTIDGNVLDGVRINQYISKEFEKMIPTVFESLLVGSFVFKVGGGYFTNNGLTVTYDERHRIGKHYVYRTNVDVFGIVSTKDTLTWVPNEVQKNELTLIITPSITYSEVQAKELEEVKNPKVSAAKPGTATAWVNGKLYTGSVITVVLHNNRLLSEDSITVLPPTIDPNAAQEAQKLKVRPKMLIKGNVGNKVSIVTDLNITVNGGIGEDCHIESTQEGLTALQVGFRTEIKVSGMQKILKPNPIPTPVAEKAQSLQGVSIFTSQPAILTTSTTVVNAIPKGFYCPITKEVMKDPVFCTLDNRSYERTAIENRLALHRTTPDTLVLLSDSKSFSAVLFTNIALRETINEFRLNNPQLFGTSSLRYM